MSKTIIEMFLHATLAQLAGVTLALAGCIGVLKGKGIEFKWSGVGIPFLVAYSMFIVAIVYYCKKNGNPIPMELNTYMKFILMYLYVDAILLPIMVNYSGGVKQSLFSPLFFVIPAMAVVFVSRSAILHIYGVVGVTLAGYIVVYLFSEDNKISGRFYKFCECGILVSSVILSVFMSLSLSPLP